MIIGYFPGGGGNRFFNYCHHRDFSQLAKAYDNQTNHDVIRMRGEYLVGEKTIDIPADVTVLLHCVNYPRMREKISTNEHKIYIIKTDLKKSLRREWSLKGKYKSMWCSTDQDFLLELYNAMKDPSWPVITDFDQYQNLPTAIVKEVDIEFSKNIKTTASTHEYNFITAAYTSISWHLDTYAKYPLDPGLASIIDVDNDSSAFSEVMRKELDLYDNNPLFDFAWDTYMNYGSNAPIIDLYQNEH